MPNVAKRSRNNRKLTKFHDSELTNVFPKAMAKHLNQILDEIKTKFISVGIDKLVLFGSFAYGIPREDSDIDLLVVTSDDRIPQSFSEKSRLDITFSRLIDDIKSQVPIDLIVQTRGMHKKFVEKDSLFGREILTKGRVLYERSF